MSGGSLVSFLFPPRTINKPCPRGLATLPLVMEPKLPSTTTNNICSSPIQESALVPERRDAEPRINLDEESEFGVDTKYHLSKYALNV